MTRIMAFALSRLHALSRRRRDRSRHGLLALNHLVPADDPLVTEGHWMEAVRRHYAGPLMIGHDGLTLPLTSAHRGSSAPGKA